MRTTSVAGSAAECRRLGADRKADTFDPGDGAVLRRYRGVGSRRLGVARALPAAGQRRLDDPKVTDGERDAVAGS